jgi:hypothetical protein
MQRGRKRGRERGREREGKKVGVFGPFSSSFLKRERESTDFFYCVERESVCVCVLVILSIKREGGREREIRKTRDLIKEQRLTVHSVTVSNTETEREMRRKERERELQRTIYRERERERESREREREREIYREREESEIFQRSATLQWMWL